MSTYLIQVKENSNRLVSSKTNRHLPTDAMTGSRNQNRLIADTLEPRSSAYFKSSKHWTEKCRRDEKEDIGNLKGRQKGLVHAQDHCREESFFVVVVVDEDN